MSRNDDVKNGESLYRFMRLFLLLALAFNDLKQYGHYDSRQLAVAGRSLNIVKPNPIHGRLLVLV
jgi:hypothetical protein